MCLANLIWLESYSPYIKGGTTPTKTGKRKTEKTVTLPHKEARICKEKHMFESVDTKLGTAYKTVHIKAQNKTKLFLEK